MSSASSVQFKGINAAVQAYEHNDVPSFAIVCGKDILYQWIGEDITEGSALLRGYLDLLKEAHSDAAYQLRIYAEPPGRWIKSSDPCNFSFKFKLYADEEALDYRGLYSVKGDMEKRLQFLESFYNNTKEAEEEAEAEAEAGVLGKVGKIVGTMLENPEMQKMIIGAVWNFTNKITSNFFGAKPAPATVNGVPDQNTTVNMAQDDSQQLYENMPEDQRKMLDLAVPILLKHDPKFGEHLYKLAIMCRDNPTQYAFASSMLK